MNNSDLPVYQCNNCMEKNAMLAGEVAKVEPKRVSIEERFPIFEINDQNGRGEYLISFNEKELEQIRLSNEMFWDSQELIRNKLKKEGKYW